MLSGTLEYPAMFIGSFENEKMEFSIKSSDSAYAFRAYNNGAVSISGSGSEYAFSSRTGSGRFVWYADIGKAHLFKDGIGNLITHSGTQFYVPQMLTSGLTNWVVRDPSTGEFTTYSSSEKVKENIFDMEDVGNYIDQLRPVTFKFKANPNSIESEESKWIRENTKNYGFISEEVGSINNGHFASWSILDDKVTLEPLVWKFPDILAISIKEIQSLRRRVAELESKI